MLNVSHSIPIPTAFILEYILRHIALLLRKKVRSVSQWSIMISSYWVDYIFINIHFEVVTSIWVGRVNENVRDWGTDIFGPFPDNLRIFYWVNLWILYTSFIVICMYSQFVLLLSFFNLLLFVSIFLPDLFSQPCE